MSRGTQPEGAGPTRAGGGTGRIVARVLIALILTVVLVPLFAILLLQLDGISTRVANAVAARALPWPHARADIGHAALTGIGTLALYDVRIAHDDGRLLLAIDTVQLRVRPLRLLAGRLIVPELRIAGARAVLRQQSDSTWDLLAPFTAADTTRRSAAGGDPLHIRMDRVDVERTRVEAHFQASTDSVLVIDGLTARVRDVRLPESPALSVDTLGASIRPPTRESPAALSARLRLGDRRLVVDHVTLGSDSSDVSATGDLLLPGADQDEIEDIDFRLVARPLDFRDVGALVPGFDVAGSLRLDVHVAGSASLLEVRADGHSFDGATFHAEGRLTPRTTGRVRYQLAATVRDLDASLWTAGSAPVADVHADVEVDLAGPALDSIGGHVDLRVEGARIAGGALRPSRISAVFDAGHASFAVAGGIEPWFDVEADGTARPFLDVPEWDVDVTLAQRRPFPDSGAFQVRNASVRLHATGRGIGARTAEGRARAALNADLGDVRLRDGTAGVEWSGGGAGARLALPLADGNVRVDASVRWDTDPLQYRVSRLVARDIDLTQFADSLHGRLFLEGEAQGATAQLSAVRANATVRVDSAGWGSLVLDTTNASLILRDGSLEVEARAASAAGRMVLNANGRPFADLQVWNLESLNLQGIDLAQAWAGLPQTHINATLAMELRGTAPARMAGRGRLDLDSSRIGQQEVGPGTLRLALDTGHVAVQGETALLGGSMTLQASAQPFLEIPTFRVEPASFTDLDMTSLTAERVRTRLTGTLQVQGELPPDQLPEARGELHLEATTVNNGRLEDAQATFTLAGGRASMQATARTAQGTARIDGAGTILDRDTAGFEIADARLDGVLRLPDFARLIGADSVASGLDADVHVAGNGSRLETMQWTAVANASGSWGATRLDTLRLDARIADGVLQLDTFALAANVAHGAGGGTLALTDDAVVVEDTLHIRLVADTTEAGGTLIAIRPFGIRLARLDLRAHNEDGDVQVDGSLHMGGLITGTSAADSIAVLASATLHDGSLEDVSATFDARALAFGSFFVERLNGEVTRDTSGIAFTAEITKEGGHAMTLSGEADTRERSLLLSTLGFSFGAEHWALADTARITWADRIAFTDLVLGSADRRIALDGHLDQNGTQDLTLRLDSVPVQNFTAFAGVEGLTGTVQGTLRLEGPAADVGVRTDLFARLEGVTANIRTEPADGRLGIDADFTDDDDQPLRVTGSVPFSLSLAPDDSTRLSGTNATFELNVSAQSFSVAWLEPLVRPFGIDAVAGNVSADLRLDGTIDQPRATGSIALAAGRIRIARQGVDYRAIAGDLQFAGNRVQIANLRAEAEGDVVVTGEVGLDPLDNPRFDIQFRFDEFLALRNEYVRLGLDGNLTLAGDLAEPHVTGSLRAEGTDVYADRIGQEGTARPVELTAEDYEMLESYFGYRPGDDLDQSDPLGPWSIDVALEIGSDVWVRKRVTPEMRIQLSGSLDVRKQPAASMQLFGTVEVVPERSYVEQFGKRFRIDQGTATFNGAIMGWRTAIAARYAVPAFQDPSASEVVITLDVTGGMDDLELTLGSEPQMETADVLSYIATGRPAASAAEFGSLSQTGRSFALGAVADVLADEAAQRIGLDVVEVRQDGSEGATLIAGRYVSPRLYVGFQQPLTLRKSDGSIDESGVSTQVEIEYAAWRWLLINLQGGQSEFRWFFRTRRAF